MAAIARIIETYIESSSWIRRMFEEGARLKAEHGAENVFDFSLGNPTIEPPEEFRRALREAALDARPGLHRYMPNTGYPEVRAKVAATLQAVHGLPVTEEHVVMTVGAAGALNCTLKAILDPDDEVIVLAPFFPEYRFYIENHRGRVVVCETTESFDLDIDAIESALNERTRAIIVNSPNNPTGRIYRKEDILALGRALAAAESRFGRPIYLLGDEPYRKIAYDVEIPSLFEAHPNTVICTSHSKDLGLPGERIGYAAINPRCPDAAELYGAMAFTNRILGFVNAPALMQRVVGGLQDVAIDAELYRRKRDRLVTGLREAGYEVIVPEGAFYLFPKTPISDDVAFIKILSKHLVLGVPGRGFARPGHFRLAYCVDDETIERGLKPLGDALREAKSG